MGILKRNLLVVATIATTCGSLGVVHDAAAQSASGSASISSMPGVSGGSNTSAPIDNSYYAQSSQAPAGGGNPTNDADTSSNGYTPPNAAQLIQLLAPVAVFPDKLVAQVLAAASYPDQVAEANTWLAQNTSLKGAALQDALAQRDWDPGVKAIVAFPDVLHQMADNPQWTAALGEAYVNDPTDVLNAVQALRQKAIAQGNLKSNKYVNVNTVARDAAPVAPAPVDDAYDEDDAPPPVYDGPPVIEPPEQIVEIVPAEPDYVYVPYFDPGVFYGSSIGYWPGYAYTWPTPVYYGPAFGAFAFGAAIAIDFSFGHPWGWGRWHTRWGHGYYGHGNYGHGGWRGPSVVYNNRPYFNHSSHIVNHYRSRGALAGRDGNRFGADRVNRANVNGAGHDRVGNRANMRSDRFSAARNVNFNRMATPHFTGAMAERGRNAAASASGLSRGAARAPLASRSFAPSRGALANRGGATFNREPASNRAGQNARGRYSPPMRSPAFNRADDRSASRTPALNRSAAIGRSGAINRGAGYNRSIPSSGNSSVARGQVQQRTRAYEGGRSFANQRATAPRQISAPRQFSAPRQASAPRQFSAQRQISTPRQFSAPRQMSAPRQVSAPRQSGASRQAAPSRGGGDRNRH